MGIFTRKRSVSDDLGAKRGELAEAVRDLIPNRFEPLGEVLASGSGSSQTCTELGQALAGDGASLAEALEALRTTCVTVRGTDPTYDEVLALGQAWSEATLGYFHQVSCDDPLTGLASQAHLRSRIGEIYRGSAATGRFVSRDMALVVAEIGVGPSAGGMPTPRASRLSQALLVTKIGANARSVFGGAESIGRLGESRVAAIAARDKALGKRVALLRRMLLTVAAGRRTRVWIEGLPASEDGAVALLDELSRC